MNHPLMEPRRLTVEEFRAMEALAPADERWELINGVMVKSQAGTTVRHNDIVQNVASIIRAELRRKGSKCRTSTENIRLDIENATTSVMPDVIVNCGERRGPSTTFRTASVIVEVISPSTSADDKVSKLETYFTLAELRTAVMIEQAEMRVVSYTRSAGGWFAATSISQTIASRWMGWMSRSRWRRSTKRSSSTPNRPAARSSPSRPRGF